MVVRFVSAKVRIPRSDKRKDSRNLFGVVGEVLTAHHRWLDDNVIAANSRFGGGAYKFDHRFAVYEWGATALVVDVRLRAVAFGMAHGNRAHRLFQLLADLIGQRASGASH